MVQNLYSKMHPVSCTITHCDDTDLVNHGMVENTKKLNILRMEIKKNWKKNLDLCCRLCLRNILRSHRFVPEVTFNSVRNILSFYFALHSDWTSTAVKSSRLCDQNCLSEQNKPTLHFTEIGKCFLCQIFKLFWNSLFNL